MNEPGTMHCGRCAHEVAPVRPWAGFLWIRRGWYAGLLLLIAFAPIIMSEITVLLPLAVMFALAAGPVHGLAAQRATCSECGAELGATRVPSVPPPTLHAG